MATVAVHDHARLEQARRIQLERRKEPATNEALGRLGDEMRETVHSIVRDSESRMRLALLSETRTPIPPCDLDAERELVSSAMAGYLDSGLREEHFFSPAFGLLYVVAQGFARERARPNDDQMLTRAVALGAFAPALSIELDCIRFSPVSVLPKKLADRVIALAHRRRVLAKVVEAEALLRSPNGDLERAVELLVAALDEAST